MGTTTRPRGISAQESRLLAAIGRANSTSPAVVAREAKLKEHVVRYLLAKMKEQGVITPTAFLNSSLLGYSTINLFFSIPHRRPEAILEFLKGCNQVCWLCTNFGEYRYELTMLVRRIEQLPALIDQLAAQFSVTLSNKSWAVETSFHFFGHPFLDPPSATKSCLYTIESSTEVVEVDLLDRRLLSLLRAGAGGSESELARKLRVPASTVRYRLARLRKLQVVSEDTFSLSPHKLGFQEYQLLIDARVLSPKVREKFMRWCAEQLQVIACIRCFGGWEYKLIYYAANIEEAYALQDKLLVDFEDNFTATLVPRRELLKRSFELLD